MSGRRAGWNRGAGGSWAGRGAWGKKRAISTQDNATELSLQSGDLSTGENETERADDVVRDPEAHGGRPIGVEIIEGGQKERRHSNPSSTQEDVVGSPSTDTSAVTESSQRQGRQSNLSSAQEGAAALQSTDAPVVTEGSQRQGRQSNPSSAQEGVVALQTTDTPVVTEGSQRQGGQSNPSSAQEGAVALQTTDTPVVTEGSQRQGRQSNPSSAQEGAVALQTPDTPVVTEGSQRQGRQSNPPSAQEGAVALQSTDTPVVAEGSQRQGRQSNPSSAQEGAVALQTTDTPAVREGSQRQGRQSNPSSAQEGAVALQSTDTPVVTEGNQRQGRQSNPPSAQEGAVALQTPDTPVVTEGSHRQGRQSIPSSAQEGTVALQTTDTPAVREGSPPQWRQSNPSASQEGAAALQSTDTPVVTEGIQRQGRQSNPSSAQEGAVALQTTDTPVVTEGSQRQGRQSNPSSAQEGAVALQTTDTPVVTEGSQRQGRQSNPSSAQEGAVALQTPDTPVVTEGSQRQGRQSNPPSAQEGAVALQSTDTPVVTEGSQRQGRQSNPSSAQEGVVALQTPDTPVVTEGSHRQGRQSNPSSAQEGAVALQTTDTPAVREGSPPQWRESNPSASQEGAAALQSTDTPAVLTENQQQGIQPISTTTHNYFGSVSKYDLSNSSQISLGNPEHRGCVSQASLSIRIKQLNEVFEEIRSLQKAEDVLKRHNHVAVCGAPGDGKTSIALKMCEKYLKKKYEVVFVDNIEAFHVDTIIQRQTHMLVVFDDIFGSVTYPSDLQNIKKVLTALADALVNISVQKEQDKKKREQKKLNADKKNTEALPNEETKAFHKLRFIFTSRTYNWKEGCNRLHQFKINLFKAESIIDMTTTSLTTKEKESILDSFWKRNQMFDMSSQDKNTVTQLQDNMFGFPLICQLYCTNPAFQMHKMTNFFQNPVSYLRGDLDTIIREGSSRSAALVLLVLCGGKLDLVSFKSGTKFAELFRVVKEEIASCSRTGIGKEISSFTGTYCTVENHIASFSHPSIHDAAACALGHLNEVLLLEHCSLQFLYERVRYNRDDGVQSTHIDDVTNMIYITSNLYPLVITRLAQGVREGYFRWTVGHPIFSNVQIASSFLTQIMMDLPNVVHAKDTTSGECFLYWVSLSTNHSLFDHSLSLMCRVRGLSNSVVTDFYDGILGCIQHGNLQYLKRIVAALKQCGRFDVDRRIEDHKTLLMIAAEAGQLDVFNFLLEEGADVSATDNRHYSCLHHSCKSGSKDIVTVLIKQFQHLINAGDNYGKTPAMLCAESGQLEILKLLVLHKADVTTTNSDRMNSFHIGCIKGHVSVVEYLLTVENVTIDMRGGILRQTSLMMAAERGHFDVYNLLVLEGADVSLTDEYSSDCLMLACERGNMSIVKHLLSLNTFDINIQERTLNQSAVMVAAERGHNDVYNLLVSEGADLSLTDGIKRDCLMLACEGGNVSIVKHLLSLNTFDINRQVGAENLSAVMVAAERGHYDVYNLLVSEGANVSLTDEDNRDCLMLACEGGNMSIVKHLLSLNTFDINRQGVIGNRSAVMVAAERGHYDVYNLLVSEGADLSLTDESKRDCLMLACVKGNMSILKHLLSLTTFDINRQGGIGNLSAVMMAAERGRYDVYNLLVSEGADVSLTDEDNGDCLMLACEGGNMSIVKHLLSLKTFDINRQGGIGYQSAVMMAAESGHHDVYNLLVSEGADMSLIDEDNRDCLMLACDRGYLSIVKHLLSLKTFDINTQGGMWNQSAVMMAAARGHYDVYNLLVSEGADLSLTNENNTDCLMWACIGGNVSIVKHLLSLKQFGQGQRGLEDYVTKAEKRNRQDIVNLMRSSPT